ncbi:putative transporter SVOPL [Battus philenor]|uniref:putative transporter SVOPL n=1 Tax=Battus philenor TaxID=42288 RepID=UPI0035CE9562
MTNSQKIRDNGNVAFEDALNMAGFGWYSYAITALSGFSTIAFACIVFSTTFIIPTSACELGTTSAQQGLLASIPIIWIIAGNMVCGFLGDKYGRRQMLLYTLLSAATVNALASLSPNWVVLIILLSVAAFCAAGIISLAMTFVSECVPALKRNVVVLLVTSLFLTSQGVMALIAIPIIPLSFSIYLPVFGIYWNSWRTLLLVYSVPSLLAALGLLFVTESPKYMFARGQEQDAIDIIRTIHRLNHQKSAGNLNIENLIMETQEFSGPNEKESTRDRILPLFKMPLLKYTTVMTVLFMCQQLGAFTVWLPIIANQFIRVVRTGEGMDKSICGLISDSRSIPADPNTVPCSLNIVSLLFVMVVSLIQSIANALLSLIVNRLGRRNMAIILTIVCGTCGIVTNLVPNAYASAAIFIVFMVGILVFSLHSAIAVVLFPTHLRAFAVAFTMNGSRMGGIASIQILKLLLDVNCEAGFYLFNSIFTASAILLLFLPDDRFLRKPQPTKQDETEKILEKTFNS